MWLIATDQSAGNSFKQKTVRPGTIKHVLQHFDENEA
jgi:hypothetical protein